MTLNEYQNRKTPDYYPTMAQDGFTPHEILAAVHKKMVEESRARDADKPTEIHITSEVKTK